MNESFWAKMPCSWQIDANCHRGIGEAPTGEGIAALKLYIALCLKANYSKKETLPATGCVKRSISQLCSLTRLSRPMVVRGLRLLREWDVIEVLGGRPETYHIKEYETARYWTKLPAGYLYGADHSAEVRRITAMSNRSVQTLRALQLYLYIAAIRDKTTGMATVTYKQIAHVLGVGRTTVSGAISTLVAHNLLTVRLAEDTAGSESRPSNVYWLGGSDSDPERKRKTISKARVVARFGRGAGAADVTFDDFDF